MIKLSFKNSNLNEGNLKKRRCFRKGAIYMNEGVVLKDFSMQTLLTNLFAISVKETFSIVEYRCLVATRSN